MDTNQRNQSTNSPLGDLVQTADGSYTLSHPDHGECYHSHAGAAAEARELYVVASGISERWTTKEPVAVLDVGLGLGYNAVTTIAAWQRAENPGDLAVVSLEIDPLLVETFSSGFAPWQSNWGDREIMIPRSLRPTSADPTIWSGTLHHPTGSGICDWTVITGDALTKELPTNVFDYVWQDPFSPTKNPSMWSTDWFERVKRAAKPGAVLMTYSVARVVKDALTGAGWTCARFQPPAGSSKRHWLRSTKSEMPNGS